jgi:hypothetical protein
MRFGKIPTAVAHCGVGRTTLYKLAAKNAGLFRKFGKTTLVDLDMLDSILASLPNADIKVPSLLSREVV